MPDLIAVTGATGQMGGRVARRLADRGIDQRLLVRDTARAPRLDGAQAATITGYGDRESVRSALAGAGTLFFVPGEEAQDRVEQHKTVVDAAVEAGVERIVYLSFLAAQPDSSFTLARHHWATEEHIRSKDVAFSFVRMSMYMDFMPLFDQDGVIRGPGGNGRVGAVLRDDLADVAAAVLADPAAHDGASYDVTGPSAFTLAELADALTRFGGRPVRYEEETLDDAWASRRTTGAPDWEIEGWITSYVAIASGDLDLVTDTVRRIAGHDPVSLEEYLRARAAPPTSP